MKIKTLGATLLAITGLSLSLDVTAQNTSFSGVSWSRDNSNTPTIDADGCGDTPTATTSSSATLTFSLTGCTSGTQRQEFLYERRSGIHAMVGYFSFSDPDFNEEGAGVSVAQTHDDQTGSTGVFTIYRLHYRDAYYGGRYYLTPQTDETSRYSFSWARVYADSNYYMDIQTYTDGEDSFERARLWDGASTSADLMRTWVINDGSGDDDTAYKKIGAYALTDSEGTSIDVTWNGVKFYTGSW